MAPPEHVLEHVSYSSLSAFMECGKKWQLRYRVGLPDRPAWWNIGGHAVHSATEQIDRAMFAEVGA